MLCDGQPAGVAAPLVIGRHSHPRATPEIPETTPIPTTGIDYLALIDAARDSEVARTVNYAALMPPPDQHDQHDQHEPTALITAQTRTDTGNQPHEATSIESETAA
ncbi:MAG TPA: hypothetical protein VFU73_07325 [Actinocrinis sp.]|nr:hypothetical protein [Actinocrinis sp.]